MSYLFGAALWFVIAGVVMLLTMIPLRIFAGRRFLRQRHLSGGWKDYWVNGGHPFCLSYAISYILRDIGITAVGLGIAIAVATALWGPILGFPQ